MTNKENVVMEHVCTPFTFWWEDGDMYVSLGDMGMNTLTYKFDKDETDPFVRHIMAIGEGFKAMNMKERTKRLERLRERLSERLTALPEPQS